MQERAQEILREKLVGIINTYDETSKEIESTLAQMNEAFELLMAKPEQARVAQGSLPAQDEEGLEWEDVAEENTAEGERQGHCVLETVSDDDHISTTSLRI